MKEVMDGMVMIVTNIGNVLGIGYVLRTIFLIPGSKKLLRRYGKKKLRTYKKWFIPALIVLVLMNLYSLFVY